MLLRAWPDEARLPGASLTTSRPSAFHPPRRSPATYNRPCRTAHSLCYGSPYVCVVQAGELAALLQVVIDVSRRGQRAHFPEPRVKAIAELICPPSASDGLLTRGPCMKWPRKLQLMMVAALLHIDMFPTSLLDMLPVAAHATADDVVAHRLLSVVVHAGERVSLEHRVSVLLSAALARPVGVYPRTSVGEVPMLPQRFGAGTVRGCVQPHMLDACCQLMRALAASGMPGRSGPRSLLRYCAAASAEVLRAVGGAGVDGAWLANFARQECASLHIGLARALLQLMVASISPCEPPSGGDAAAAAVATATPWLVACVIGSSDGWRAADVQLCEALISATGSAVVEGLMDMINCAPSGRSSSAGAAVALPLGLGPRTAAQTQLPAIRALTVLVRRGAVVVDASAPSALQTLCMTAQPLPVSSDEPTKRALAAAVQQLRSAAVHDAR